MMTGSYNHSVPGVASVGSLSHAIGESTHLASESLNDEINGAISRYYNQAPDNVIFDMIANGKIIITGGFSETDSIIDVASGDVICSFRRPHISNKSNMEWKGFATYNVVIEFKFRAFDNKLNRDSINQQRKTKGKRK